MKFIHFSDVHLGAGRETLKQIGINRYEEIWQTFRRVVEMAGELRPDLVLITGDLFHREPLYGELKEVNYILSSLPETTHIVITAGNHDYISPNSHYRNFKWNDNIDMITSERITCIYYEDIKTTVYGMSYHSKEIRENIFDDVVPQENGTNILMVHGGDDKHIPLNYRRILKNGFDYVALGHIHKPKIYEDGRMAYAGTIEPVEIDDCGERGFIYGEINEGRITVKPIRSCLRQYIHLEVRMNNTWTKYMLCDYLEEIISKKGRENIYKVILTGQKNMDFDTDLTSVYSVGNIMEIEDRTMYTYDYDTLLLQNEGNIIGDLIEELRNRDKRALFYGVRALHMASKNNGR